MRLFEFSGDPRGIRTPVTGLRGHSLHPALSEFPMISKAEMQYNAVVKQLKLGPNIKLIPPKDFEGMTYSMTIRFDNQKELKNLKEKFEEIIQHPGLGKILDG